VERFRVTLWSTISNRAVGPLEHEVREPCESVLLGETAPEGHLDPEDACLVETEYVLRQRTRDVPDGTLPVPCSSSPSS
jgi:hypothetical protein